MSTPEFGGYVAYTAGGFQCHPFGTRDITDAIKRTNTELDLPTAIALRAGRSGFRRTILNATGGSVYTYTAFVGLSEPNVNRLGSFLAFGIASKFDLNCDKIGVGNFLFDLLADLVQRVSDGKRFTSNLSVDVFNSFLSENSTRLDDVAQSLVSTGRQAHALDRPSLLVLSDDPQPLATVFNRVCNKLSFTRDIFLFDAAAKTEMQTAYGNFDVIEWPIREAHPSARPTEENVSSHNRLAPREPQTSSFAISKADLQRIRNLDKIIDKHLGGKLKHLDELAKSLRFWKAAGAVAVSGLLILLILITIVYYNRYSTITHELASVKQELKSIDSRREITVPHSSVTEPARGAALETQKPPLPVLREAGEFARNTARNNNGPKLTQMMNPREIREKYCPNYPHNNETFSSALSSLNPGVRNSNGTYGKNQQLTLPEGCNR